ncbi:hypothetical protein SK128_014906 [Halocaridina rubra]|uniref:Cytochrome b5 heme-binding domain-containing protein n=1 Tax=Halocaridina rubra TaxID=373956 RepID=A0AAN8WYT3_HALRR
MPPCDPESKVCENGVKNQQSFWNTPGTSGFRKYPTFREQGVKSPDRWLEGKRIDDDIGPYWRVHDKLYDLSSFIEKHPGGRDWLLATRGTDVTELFESSHISLAPEALLAKFYVKDAEKPRNSPFTFREDGFYKKFKSKVRPILQKVGTGPSRKMLMIMDGITTVFITLTLIATITQSAFIASIAGITLSLASIASHNFSHQRDNWRMYVIDLSMLCSYDWRITHVLSHHPFPNTFYDLEVARLEPVLVLLPDPGKNLMQRFGCRIYEYLIYPIHFYLNALKKYYLIIRGEEQFRPELLLPGLELVVMALIAPSIWGAIWIWFVVHTSNSCFWAAIALVLSHHHPDAYHEGDRQREDLDWGLCQLDATRDRAEIVGNLFLVVTTLGDHSLHHLLPTVDHSKLPYIYPVFFEMCKEYNIPYRFYSQWEMFLGKYRTLANNTPSTQLPGYKPHND